MPQVEVDAKVKGIKLALVEPKNGPEYTRTSITLEFEQELTTAELGVVKGFMRGLGCLVRFSSRQAELPLTEAEQADADDGGQALEDDHLADGEHAPQ